MTVAINSTSMLLSPISPGTSKSNEKLSFFRNANEVNFFSPETITGGGGDAGELESGSLVQA